MKITRTNQSETSITLSIIAAPEELRAAKEVALSKLAPQVKLQGFRPGHAPTELVEKQLDPNTLQQETINEVLSTLYGKALDTENIRPVSQPSVELKKFVPYTDMEFSISVEVVGPIKLGDYKKLGVTKKDATVAAADVTEVLTRLQTQSAEYEEVDRKAKNGDRVWIDFEGKDAKGEAVKGAKGEDYPLALGSNTFIPGFEENLVGVKKDDVKEFTIPFPKDYGVKALQGKKVTFTVIVKKVEETKLPALDAEFAKKVGAFESIEDLKKDIKKQIKVERENQAEKEYQDALIKKLIDTSKMELPESLLSEQMDIVDKEFRQNLIYRGQTFQEYLESTELTEEEYREQELKTAASERLKAGLALSEVADIEKITITAEELEIRIQVLKGQYGDDSMHAELEKPENRREVASRLLTEKTVNKIVELNK